MHVSRHSLHVWSDACRGTGAPSYAPVRKMYNRAASPVAGFRSRQAGERRCSAPTVESRQSRVGCSWWGESGGRGPPPPAPCRRPTHPPVTAMWISNIINTRSTARLKAT